MGAAGLCKKLLGEDSRRGRPQAKPRFSSLRVNA